MQTLTFFKRSMLWIWGISQVVLFAPFMWGAALEQATGIWCASCFATDACIQTVDPKNNVVALSMPRPCGAAVKQATSTWCAILLCIHP